MKYMLLSTVILFIAPVCIKQKQCDCTVDDCDKGFIYW
jgi:hypothetical protein